MKLRTKGIFAALLVIGLISSAGPVGAVDKSSGPVFSQVSAGLFHTCAVTVEGGLFCWGSNTYGQLGTGDTDSTTMPRPVSGDISSSTVVQVSAGSYHTCAITAVGDLYCWGANFSYGLLGVGNSELFSSPTPLLVNSGALENAEALSVEVDGFNACAITSDEQVACWGMNNYGQIGLPANMDVHHLVPTLVSNGALADRTVKSLALGGDSVCAITDRDRLACWGRSSYVANGSIASSHRPRLWNSGFLRGKAVDAAGTGLHTCAITKGQRLACWRDGYGGAVGNGNQTMQLIPVRINTGSLADKDVSAVSVGPDSISCAITTLQKLSCWGANGDGQVGDGSTTERLTPVRISSGALRGKNVSSVSAGENHTCAITSLGTVVCWGDNSEGQIGDGTIIDRLRPRNVSWVE